MVLPNYIWHQSSQSCSWQNTDIINMTVGMSANVNEYGRVDDDKKFETFWSPLVEFLFSLVYYRWHSFLEVFLSFLLKKITMAMPFSQVQSHKVMKYSFYHWIFNEPTDMLLVLVDFKPSCILADYSLFSYLYCNILLAMPAQAQII